MSLNANYNFIASMRAKPPKLDELLACMISVDELKNKHRNNPVALNNIEKFEQETLSIERLSVSNTKDDHNSNVQLLSELKN